MHATALHVSRSQRRLGYAILAAALVALILLVYARETVGWWPVVVFALAPDIPLFLGVGRGLERGRLHPRAVPLYNAVHRFWGPLALGAAAVAASLPSAWLVAALAWAIHIAIDRAVGYGLRASDGFQRP
jgi:hypothetical protein